MSQNARAEQAGFPTSEAAHVSSVPDHGLVARATARCSSNTIATLQFRLVTALAGVWIGSYGVRVRRSGRRVVTGLVTLALVLAAGGAIAWYAGLRNQFFPINFGVVEPGRIYRSGQISRRVIRRTLAQNHIGVIIDLSSRHEATPDALAERAAAREMGVLRINLTLLGNGTGDPTVYPRVIEDIVNANRAGKAVLVHCQSGAQRTGGIVAAYRILIEGRPAQQAFAEMERYGHRPHANPKLIPFIREHLAVWKARLAADAASKSTPATARR